MLVDFILETGRRDGGNVGRAISSRCLMASCMIPDDSLLDRL